MQSVTADVPDLNKSTKLGSAVATSVLTMVTSNSVLGGHLDRGRSRSRRARSSGPRSPGRRAGAPARSWLGGARKHHQGFGHALAHLAGALQVDLEQRRSCRRRDAPRPALRGVP